MRIHGKWKQDPTWKECYHKFDWFHLFDKSSFGCFSSTAACRCQHSYCYVSLFFSLYVFAYFSLWWFLLLPAKNQSRPYGIRTIVQVILNTLHTTNLFTQRPNKMSSKLHFAHSTAKLSIPCGCFAGIVPAFVFLSTSFTSLFTIFLNTFFYFHIDFEFRLIRVPSNPLKWGDHLHYVHNIC